jgi:hypothetical protein
MHQDGPQQDWNTVQVTIREAGTEGFVFTTIGSRRLVRVTSYREHAWNGHRSIIAVVTTFSDTSGTDPISDVY